MCKLTSKERPLFLKFVNSDIRTKCEEELIGKNSVMPCIKERTIISNII